MIFLVGRKKRRPKQGCSPSFLHSTITIKESRSMMDIILVGIGVLFFLLCVAYTKACDSL
ncbi:MAG: hypothetical protein E6Q76_17055 [Rhizobium sp.]|nr:MAG: hypothetical protein E6Q76_17055 [Rhizobium sp.]